MASPPIVPSLNEAGESVAAVSLTLSELVNNTPLVDANISLICKDIVSITNLLLAFETVVDQLTSQTSRLAPIDSFAWQQINDVLIDCAGNASALADLVIPDSWFTGPMELLEMRSLEFRPEDHKREVLALRSRIRHSKCAVRTALAVANLSLLFQPDSPQHTILDGLDLLNRIFQETLQAAYLAGAQSELRPHEHKNLEAIGRMAEKFHAGSNLTALKYYGITSWSEPGGMADGRRKSTEVLREKAKPQSAEVDWAVEGTLHQKHEHVLTLPGTARQDRPSMIGDKDANLYLYLDMPSNFEDLALNSFHEGSYQRAEQCLRMAVAQLAGDKLKKNKCIQLKLQLAVCCCLQDKWDHAIGLIDVLPKTQVTENLPIFHLLQSLSLSYLQQDMLDEAFSACDTALQAKKKILGRDHDECYECQFILASICEKRGMPSDAEALRRTIPLTWTPKNYGDLLSARQCILGNTSFLERLFSRDMHNDLEAPRTGVSDQGSGHWTSLVLGNALDGEDRAEYDEGRDASLAEMDTGKEVIMRTHSTQHSFSEASLKEPSRAKDKFPIQAPASTPRTLHKDTDSIDTNIQSPSSLSQQDTTPSTLLCADKVTELSSDTSFTPFDRLHDLWAIGKDLGKLKGPKPPGMVPVSPSLPLSKPAKVQGYFVGVSVRCQARDSFVLRKENGEVEIFQMPLVRSLESAAHTRHFTSKSASSTASPFPKRSGNPLTSTLNFTVDLEKPRDWSTILKDSKWKMSLVGREREMRNNLKTATSQIESHIAKQIMDSQGRVASSVTQLRFGSLVYTVPDIVYRSGKSFMLEVLADFDLMKYAKVVPHSIAVVQQCIGALKRQIVPRSTTPLGVIVLNCDEILVECVPLMMRPGTTGNIEIQEFDTIFMAETAGCGHVRATFARLVEGRLKIALDRLGRKMPNSGIEDIIQTCCKQFDQRIFAEFEDTGEPWQVGFDLFPDMPGFERGRCNLSNAEMAMCFSPSVEMVKKMLRATVEEMRSRHCRVSRILLAGQYSMSKYLHKVLRELVGELNQGLSEDARLKMIGSRLSGDHICGLGALSCAMSAKD